MLLTRLDLEGIVVSTGSACTAGTVDPSHVLASLYGDDSHRLTESIRVSFSELNTIEEVQELHKIKRNRRKLDGLKRNHTARLSLQLCY